MTRLTICVLAAGCCAALAADDIAPPPRPVDVAGIVRQLGSDDFAEREAAVRRLSTLNVDAVPPELLGALKSPNPEVRERAAKAVQALRERIALMPLPRAERFAKRGQIDLYVASTAAGEYKADDPRLWEPAMELGRTAVKQADKVRGRELSSGPVTFPNLAWYKKDAGPSFTRVEQPYGNRGWGPRAIQAPGVQSHVGFVDAIVVSHGPVSTARSSQVSLFLAAGDFDCGDNFSRSVVICDGDVRVKSNVFDSVIVARGDISVKGLADVSTLVAGGKISIGKPPEAVSPVPLADPQREIVRRENWEHRVVIEEKAVRPLGYITFFELSTVGVEVKLADTAVKVTAVADGEPFAAAGVRVGDVITAVNGKRPESAESLRRLLRDALAVGNAAVTLKRGDNSQTVKVSLPE